MYDLYQSSLTTEEKTTSLILPISNLTICYITYVILLIQYNCYNIIYRFKYYYYIYTNLIYI